MAMKKGKPKKGEKPTGKSEPAVEESQVGEKPEDEVAEPHEEENKPEEIVEEEKPVVVEETEEPIPTEEPTEAVPIEETTVAETEEKTEETEAPQEQVVEEKIKEKKKKKGKKGGSGEPGEDKIKKKKEKKSKSKESVSKAVSDEEVKAEEEKVEEGGGEGDADQPKAEEQPEELKEEKPKKKKREATPEGESKKKKKKKKIEESPSTTEAPEEQPKKKKKKQKKKKTDEAPTTTESEAELGQPLTETESKVKNKKKGKKSKKVLKRVKSAGTSKQSLIRKKSSSSVRGKKSSSSMKVMMSRLSMGKSHQSIAELKAKLSSFAEVDAMRKKSSAWTFTQSLSSSEESLSGEEEEEEEEEKLLQTHGFEKKRKRTRKGKEKKEKKKKKEKSVTLGDVQVSEEIQETKKRKKKKGKKRKHEGDEATSEVTIEPQVDVLAEITRMKYLAELEASGEVTEEETTEPGTPKKKKKKKKKKGPKKKLSKKEKQRLAAEQAEKARLNAEEEAAKAAELERIRLEEERKAAIEKEKRECFEQQIRMEQLEWILELYKEILNYNKQLRASAKAQADWEFYVNCGRLPNPSKCDQMNTFLHLWENMIQETTMEEAARRTTDVLELLNELDDLIDTTEIQNKNQLENWKWVRLLFRQQQSKSLDVATYKLLRNIEKNLNRIDIPTADYKYQDENIALCLWLRIQLPTPLPNPRRPPKPRIEVDFPEMKMEVQFPLSIDGDKTAVRALYVKYDHLSDLSETYQKPSIPEEYDIELYTAMKKEWREKLIYKYANRVRKPPPPPKEGEESVAEEQTEEPEEETFEPDEEIPTVPYRKLEPTASEFVISNEDELYSQTRQDLIKNVTDDVINMRKYSIIGGVYSLNLVHQPPQPQDFVTLEMNLTPLYLPKQLELVDLYLDFEPPAPSDPGIRRPPEEIEEEMKKLEEELENLILITLTWPEHVIFLELPMVCYWDEDRQVWTKNEVHDLKHNEEKGQLSFRTRKGGTFALAVYRYANLPYQTWELKPEANGTVSLQITAAILMVEFNVKDGLIALSQLQNSPNNALQDIVGIYFPLPKLIRMLQNAGVDVFPAFDAFCYVETSCEKHWPMEKHLYFNMAQLSICFNFAWSRWNIASGRRNIILQMREYNIEKTKQKNHLMLLVTPLYALFVDCTEVSQTFNEEGIENMKFYPDLYHLMKGTSNMAVKNKITKASKELIYALYELLLATRVVSFS